MLCTLCKNKLFLVFGAGVIKFKNFVLENLRILCIRKNMQMIIAVSIFLIYTISIKM